MKAPEKQEDTSRVISLRVDKITSERIMRMARRMRSSKSCVVRIAIDRVLAEAEAGVIKLTPEHEQAVTVR